MWHLFGSCSSLRSNAVHWFEVKLPRVSLRQCHDSEKECLRAATVSDNNDDHLKTVLESFSKFLCKILLESQEVTHLAKFSPLFSKLVAHGAQVPQVAVLLQRLAAPPTNSTVSVDAGAYDLRVRTLFFTSNIWKACLAARRERCPGCTKGGNHGL